MSITMTINAAECTPRDWDALTAFIAAMRGKAAAPATGGTLAALAAAAFEAPPPVLPSEALIASAAAAVTIAPPPPPPAGVEVDVNGLPWDARIHAASKTKNADQSWRAKRGVDEATVSAVTAELKQIMAAPPAPIDPAAAFGAPPAPLPPPPPLAVTSLGPAAAIASPPSIVVVPDAPPAPPAVAATASPAAVASPAVSEFAELVKLVTSRQTAGTLTTDIVMTISQQLGLTGLTDFANRPDLIPAFKAMLP